MWHCSRFYLHERNTVFFCTFLGSTQDPSLLWRGFSTVDSIENLLLLRKTSIFTIGSYKVSHHYHVLSDSQYFFEWCTPSDSPITRWTIVKSLPRRGGHRDKVSLPFCNYMFFLWYVTLSDSRFGHQKIFHGLVTNPYCPYYYLVTLGPNPSPDDNSEYTFDSGSDLLLHLS